jgi:heme-degrading monooxygenase HmoA
MGPLRGPHDDRRDLWAGGRRSGMYVRVNTIEGSPDRIDDLTTHIQEQTLPQLREMEGFEGFVALGDRQSGKVLGVAFWESEEALRATEQALSSVRSGAAEAAGGTLTSVERYEVTGPVGGVTDTVGGATQPVGGVTDTVGGVTDTVGGTTGNLLGGGEKKS